MDLFEETIESLKTFKDEKTGENVYTTDEISIIVGKAKSNLEVLTKAIPNKKQLSELINMLGFYGLCQSNIEVNGNSIKITRLMKLTSPALLGKIVTSDEIEKDNSIMGITYNVTVGENKLTIKKTEACMNLQQFYDMAVSQQFAEVTTNVSLRQFQLDEQANPLIESSLIFDISRQPDIHPRSIERPFGKSFGAEINYLNRLGYNLEAWTTLDFDISSIRGEGDLQRYIGNFAIPRNKLNAIYHNVTRFDENNKCYNCTTDYYSTDLFGHFNLVARGYGEQGLDTGLVRPTAAFNARVNADQVARIKLQEVKDRIAANTGTSR